ncbi:MAG: hypothetical protein B7Z70_08970, partial [Acidithiobacillus ferrivorans]
MDRSPGRFDGPGVVAPSRTLARCRAETRRDRRPAGSGRNRGRGTRRRSRTAARDCAQGRARPGSVARETDIDRSCERASAPPRRGAGAAAAGSADL